MKRSALCFTLLFTLATGPAWAHDADCDWANAVTLIGCLHNTKHVINDIWAEVVATGNAVVDSTGTTVMTIAKQTKDTGEQTLSTLEQVGLDVVDTMENTFQIRETVQFMQDAIDSMNAIAGQIEQMAMEAEDMLVYYANHELDQFEAWAGTSGCAEPCQAFRGQLVDPDNGLILVMQDAINTLIDVQFALIVESELEGIATVPRMPHVNFVPLVEQLENLPGAVLYPLYKGIRVLEDPTGATSKAGLTLPTAEALCDGCSSTLAFIINVLRPIRDGIPATKSLASLATPEVLPVVFGHCPSLMEPSVDAALSGFSAGLKLAGVPIKFIGVILRAKGYTSVSGTHGGLAAAGHLSLRLEHNWAASLGTAFNGVADFGLALASAIDTKLRHCEVVVNQETIICMIDPPRRNEIPRDVALADHCRPAPAFR